MIELGRKIFLLVLLSLAGRVSASDDMLIFSDFTNRIYGNLVFNNGWHEYGWGTRFATNSPVHSGNLSYCLAPNGGWQAISLTQDALNTSLYTNLTFWINGGTSGGQSVGVNGMLSGVEQTRISIGINGKLPTNSWLQVSLPLATLGCANKTNFDGIRIWSNSGNVQAPFFIDDVVLYAAPPPALVHVNVNANQTVRTVDNRVFAVNATAWDGNLDTTNTINILTNMGNQALRWPGGSWGDDYHWTNEPNSVGYVNRNWGSFSTNFMHVATNTRAQVFIICNYGSSTPEEAAWGVRMFNVTNKCAFKYWEVGNENFGSWEKDINTNAPWLPHDPWTYAMRFTNYYAQMKAVDPTIKIGAVVVNSETGSQNNTTHFAVNPRTGTTNYGWTPVVLATLKSLGVTPDFLIDHEYGPDSGDTTALLWSKNWTTIAGNLRQMLNDYMGPVSTNVELNVTENGNSGNDRQRSSLVSGLFYADSLGQVLQTEINTRLWWDLRNGPGPLRPSDPALYGWRTAWFTNVALLTNTLDYYGDEGIVVGKAEPTNCYPTYYAGKLMKYFARGGDTVIKASSDHPLLGIYAVKRTNGALTLLVINKSSTASLSAAVSVAGYVPVTNATVYAYGIPQDEAARTGIGSPDVAQTSFNSAGVNFTNTFAPYSVTVLALSYVAPTVIVAPVSTNVIYGNSVVLTANATGNPPLSFQWYDYQTNLIAGATNASLVLTSSVAASGNYRVVVTSYGNRATNFAAVTITRFPLAVIANNTNRVYGATNPVFTAAYSGFVNGDTPGSAITGSPGLSTTATTASGVGSYAIVATNGSLAAANYSFNFTNGNLSVTKALPGMLLNSSLNPAGYLASLSFTAALPGDATGTVRFLTNGTAFGTNTVNLGSATSASLSYLPRGTNAITSIYSGDANYFPATNSIGQVVTNHPPLAGVASYTHYPGTPLQIALVDLTTNWSDVDGDALSLSGVSGSTNGMNSTYDGNFIYYPANTLADQFTYTNADGFGGSAVGLIKLGIVVNGTPTNMVMDLHGGNLNLSWPVDHLGWRLLAQTNQMDSGLTTNWFTWPDSTNTNAVSIPLDPADAGMFFRLVYP